MCFFNDGIKVLAGESDDQLTLFKLSNISNSENITKMKLPGKILQIKLTKDELHAFVNIDGSDDKCDAIILKINLS